MEPNVIVTGSEKQKVFGLQPYWGPLYFWFVTGGFGQWFEYMLCSRWNWE